MLAAVTKLSHWVTYIQQEFILTVLESKIKTPADSVSCGSPLPGVRMGDFFAVYHMAGAGEGDSGVSFIKALIPSVKALPP